MTPESAPAIEPQPAGMGEFSRLTGVFFEPSKTFADIAQRPRWLIPLLLVILGSLAYFVTFGQKVGWDSFVQQQMDTPRVQQQMERLSPEQRQQSMAMQAKIIPITYYVGAVIGTPIMYLFSALILWGVASGLMSAGVRYKQVFAIGCYAALTTLVSRVLAVVVMFLKDPEQFNLMNPLAFNPAAFMDPKGPKFMYTLAMGLDLFTIWGLILTAIGLKAAAGKRLSMGGAFFAVCLPYVVLLLLGASIAGAFS